MCVVCVWGRGRGVGGDSNGEERCVRNLNLVNCSFKQKIFVLPLVCSFIFSDLTLKPTHYHCCFLQTQLVHFQLIAGGNVFQIHLLTLVSLGHKIQDQVQGQV